MAKSMTEDEAQTLVAILGAYLAYLQDETPTTTQTQQSEEWPGTLLPRFFGAYVYEGRLGGQFFFTITANVFADVPREILKEMDKFDLKGSSDDRAQRRAGG